MAYPKKVLHALRRQDPRSAYRLSQLGESAFAPAQADILAQPSLIDRAISAVNRLHQLPATHLDELTTLCRERQVPLGGLLSLPDVSQPTGTLKHQLATIHPPDTLSVETLKTTLDFSQQLSMKGSQNANFLLSHFDALADALLTLEKRDGMRIMADPEIHAIRIGQSSIVTVSDAAYERYGPARVAQAAIVVDGAPLLITDNTFKDGKLGIYHQQGEWTGVSEDNPMPVTPHLVVDTMALRYKDPQHGEHVDLAAADRILNDADYFSAFLMTVAKHTDRQHQLSQPPHVRVRYHDMATVASLHNTQRDMRLPITDTIHPALVLNDKTLVIARLNQGKRDIIKIRDLADDPTARDVTLYFGETERETITFNPATLAQLKRGHREFSLRPSPDGGYMAAGVKPTVAAELTLSSQTRQQKALINKFVHQPRTYRRYISQTFESKKLVNDGGPVTDAQQFISGDATQILAQHQARGFVSLDIVKDPIYQNRPVYVGLNIYTPNKDGWYARRSQQIVTDGLPPSHIALESLGLSAADFNALADTTFSADRLLSKVFDGDARYVVLTPGAPTELDSLSKHMPLLSSQLRRSPHIVMQTYQKQQSLSTSGRDEVTFYPQINRQSPARFDAEAVLELLDKTVSSEVHNKLLSTCSNFLLQKQDDNIVLQDLSRQLSTDLGSVADIRKRVWKDRKPASFHATPGSEKRLLTYSMSRNTLKAMAPPINDPWIPVPYTDALKLAKDSKASDIDSLLQKHFSQMMENQAYDFSLSPKQNAMQLANDMDIQWDDPLMGGVGGKTGRQFLLDIKKADPRFFDRTFSGRGLSETQLLKSKQYPKNLKAVSTVTYGDLITYCCQQYEDAFPEQKQHYGALRWLPTLLEQCPPTFKTHPKEKFDALFSGHGVDPAVADILYSTLYEEQKAAPSAFSFLYQDSIPKILSTQSLQRDRAFIAQAVSTPTPSGIAVTLHQHIQQNQFRQTLKTLPLMPKNIRIIEHPGLSDTRRALAIPESIDVPSGALDLITAAIKVQNSAPGLNALNEGMTPNDKRLADDKLATQLIQIGHLADQQLSDIPNARIVVSENGLREFLEQVLMHAKDESVQVPFNSMIAPDLLTHAAKTLAPVMADMGLSNAEQERVESTLKRAHSQYVANQAIQQFRHQRESVPVLSDDRLSRLRDVAGWQHRLGHKTTPITFKEALKALADDTNNQLPKATRNALLEHANNDKTPSRHSLAYQVEQQMKRLLRQTLPHAGASEHFLALGAESNLTVREPADVLVELACVQPIPSTPNVNADLQNALRHTPKPTGR